VVVDIGTGDGRSVLRRAAAEPTTLLIGIDADAAAMAESSRRAERQRLANACFLAAGAETLADSPLAGVADIVTVTFPWGSLLRGLLGLGEPAVLAGVAAVLAPGGRLELLTSVVASDGIPGLAVLTRAGHAAIEAAWAGAGMALEGMHEATSADIEASGSTWARRLLRGSGRVVRGGTGERVVWRLTGGRLADVSVPWATTSGIAVR
jgi:16S rRNA (adenine(1408)-N(1))-methyltransferase